jgi:predicted nucleic acid-binding Zn ribbon protein
VEGSRRRQFGDPDAPPRPVGDVLDRFLAAEGLGDLRTLTTVRERWVELVGEGVARHCTPRALRGGVLVVEVDHGGWATEIRFQEGRILELLKSQLGPGVVGRLDARVSRGSGLE